MQTNTFKKEYSKAKSKREKLELLKYASLQHPYYLGKYVLGYDKFESIHYDMLSFILGIIYNKVPEALDLEPRGCYKTTALSITLPIYLELKDPDDNILINHKVKTISTSILEEIQDQYKINKLFLVLFGNRIGTIWRQGYITSKHRTKPSKEPTIAAGSVDKELVSGHYNIMINDDIVTLKDYVSKKERDKTETFYNSVRYLAEDGSIVNVGTRWHEDDLYGTVLTKTIPKRYQRIKAIVDENKKLYFPTKYPIEKINRLKTGSFLDDDEAKGNRIANILFDAVMMQKPRNDSSEKPFRELLFISEKEIEVYMKSIIFWDPAFSQKDFACFSSACCLAHDSNNRSIVKDFLYRKLAANKFIELLPGFILKNDVGILVYESNSAQVLLDDDLRQMVLQHGLNCQVVGIPSIANKHLRIMAAQPTIVSSTYFLEEKLKDDFSDYAQAVIEIKAYSKEADYKDATDSLAGATSYGTKSSAGVL